MTYLHEAWDVSWEDPKAKTWKIQSPVYAKYRVNAGCWLGLNWDCWLEHLHIGLSHNMVAEF